MSLTSVLLPDPDAPVIATSLPSGNGHVDVLQVVLARAAHDERLAVALAAPLRRRDRALAGEELSGRRRLAREHVVERALHDDPAAVHAGARPHLDEVVGGANGVLVVLDDDHRVADVAQALERRDHLHVVLRVQADARLVEHVEHAHQPRADLRRQPDPLRLAARQRARPAVEVQIVEADAEQQLEPAADLLQHLPAGVGAAARRLDGAEERVQLVEMQLADVVDGLACDREQQPRGADAARRCSRGRCARPSPCRATPPSRSSPRRAAGSGGSSARSAARCRRSRLPCLRCSSRLTFASGGVVHHDLLAFDAVEDRVADLLGQLLPRRVERELQRLRQAVHHPAVPRVRVVLERLAHEAAAEDAALRVGNQQLRDASACRRRGRRRSGRRSRGC